MAQPAAVREWVEFAAAEAAEPAGRDYAAHYAALGLSPGAALREVHDRGRLLLASFDPEGLPPVLQVLTAERSRMVADAVAVLADHWRAYGAPAPIRRPSPSPIALPAAPARPRPASDPTGLSVPAPAPAAAPGAATDTARTPPMTHLAATPSDPSTSPASVDGRPWARGEPRRQAGPGTPPAPPRPLAPAVAPAAPRSGWGRAGVLLFHAAMIALVVAAAFRLYQYRAEHPWLGVAGTPNTAVANPMPADPPAQWSGAPGGHQMLGAAAPAAASRPR